LMKKLLKNMAFLVLFSKQGLAYYCVPKQGFGTRILLNFTLVYFRIFHPQRRSAVETCG